MFDFTKDEFELMKEKLMLNEELSQILELKIKRYSITQIAMITSLSESTVNRRINLLKRKIKKIL